MCRGPIATVASGLGAVLLAASAGAATPQQIYRDLADNGQLDRPYSRADVDKALNNPSLPAYARPERASRTPQSRPTPAVAPKASVDDGLRCPSPASMQRLAPSPARCCCSAPACGATPEERRSSASAWRTEPSRRP